jgi:hypothetical protein
MTTNTKIKLNMDSLKSRREWKRHKVKDGHNVFRILPPFGEASNGYPYRKWQIIWGLTDPESGRARPFASSMTSEKSCPIAEYVDGLKKRAETMKAQLQAGGASEDDVKVRLKDLNELISNLSLKTVYIYNAADKSGEVGLLELKSTAHKKMKTAMNQYIQDYNQDPTSLNSADDDAGLWFDITREGQFRDTEYDVKKCQIKTKNATGKVSFEDDRSPLPDAVVQNYDNLAYDLTGVYQVKTYAQLAEILDFNMPNIVELVPDANLEVDFNLDGPVIAAYNQAKAVATAPKAAAPTARAAPARPVNLKIDNTDEDEDDIDLAKLAQPARKAGPMIDDAFMAEADAILNG